MNSFFVFSELLLLYWDYKLEVNALGQEERNESKNIPFCSSLHISLHRHQDGFQHIQLSCQGSYFFMSPGKFVP